MSMTYVALCAALVFGLYHVKNETMKLEKEGRTLSQEIGRTRSDIKFLEAEWATRTAPDVLARLTAQHLPRLRPTDPTQIASLASVPRRLPNPDEDTIARLLTHYEQAIPVSSISEKLRPTL
ncbi:MAG: hypothetical protein U1E87_01825 [Alphaproteobacteria bacterium]